MLKPFLDYVLCVMPTLVPCVKDVFKAGTMWNNYPDHVNNVSFYLNNHQKDSHLLTELQISDGVTNYREKGSDMM